MATFPIHMDSEKENSHFAKHKERPAAFSSRASNVLQPIGRAGAALGQKEKVPLVNGGGGVRPNFITSNQGNQQQGTRVGPVAVKAAFREVGNVKVNDENASFSTAAAKKSSAAVPVEQFKTFSVYEDQCQQQQQPQQQQQTTLVAAPIQSAVAAATSTSVVDKENCFVEEEKIKSDAFHKEFDIHHDDDDFVLDTTPMSVTDVLSPMSVDRSLTATSVSNLIDDSDCKKRSEIAPKSLPRNDRERFYEVTVYQENILEYFRESEKKHRPKPHYMRRQTDINYSMRTILVDWLVEVSEEYNLDTETLYLSVSYIDRFLSHMSVVRSKLQLVGTAAMFISAKYEEIYPPEVGEFVFITDDTYNKAQVLRMEQIILKILAFDLCTPTAYVFINTYAVLADIDDKLKFLTLYISELSLLEADPYLRFYPSLISAGALALARYTLSSSIWSAQLQKITTYSLEDLKEVVLHLSKTHNAAPNLAQQAIQEKYRAEKFRKISTIEAVELDETLFDELVRDFNDISAAKEQKAAEDNNTATTSNENVRRMISLMFN